MSESDTIDMILDATIDAPVIDKKGYRPAVPVLKVALIWIVRHPSVPITADNLGKALGVSGHWTRCVMQSLRLLKLVHPRILSIDGVRVGTVYTLNLPAIQALPRVARRATA